MTLYSWGANSHGQLGIGFESEMCITPQKVQPLPDHASIKCIIGGGGHTMILNEKNLLFVCGWNNKGQLGNGSTSNEFKFIQILNNAFDEQIISNISCGWDTSAAVFEDGSLFVWGSNLFNQLGVSKKNLLFSSIPMQLELPNKELVTSIHFGLRNACIITKNNIMYVFGKSKHLDDLQNNKDFQKVIHNNIEFWKLNSTINYIACGQNHVVYNKNNNRIEGFGDNKYNQINNVCISDQIKSLVSGWNHNGALTESGDVFLWGRNSYGQIGNHQNNSIIVDPTKLNCKERVDQVYLGAEHGLVITKSRRLLTWGWNEHGNCGNGSTENVYDPVKIELPGKSIMAGCGAGFCYALVQQIDGNN